MLKTLFSILIIVYSINVCAQKNKRIDTSKLPKIDTAKLQHDTLKVDYVTGMQGLSKQWNKKSVDEYNASRISSKQGEVIENIKRTTQRAKDYLKHSLYTDGIKNEIEQAKGLYDIAGDGVFTNKGSLQTYRNLITTNDILHVLQTKALKTKKELDDYEKELLRFRFLLDSLSIDSSLFIFPEDSASVSKYYKKLMAASLEIRPTDSSLKKAINDVEELQAQINFDTYTLASEIEEIDAYQRNIYQRTFQRELSNLTGPIASTRPFTEIIKISWVKAKTVLLFYSQNSMGRLIFLLCLIIVAALYMRTLKKTYIERNPINTDVDDKLIFRYPVISAIILVLNIFQFIFTETPFIFNCTMWVTSSLLLPVVFNKFVTKYWMKVWLALIILFMLASADNLILQASRIERWGTLFLAIAGVIIGLIVLLNGHWEELKEKWIIYAIGLMAIFELASIFANIFGRYNLSKTLLTSGYFNVIIAILFLWTIRFINEGLSLANKMYTKPDVKSFYINFEKVGSKAPLMLYIFLVIGWFILVGRNFYAFRLLSEPFRAFLTDNRIVGNYEFSIVNLFVFIFIMALTVITSKIVSFFASDKRVTSGNHKDEKVGIGSWMLLVRIGIISIGLFLAFAAAGIPMDKIAIILGALGVGIGFGLQTLVNNLVSGLIIAFEKPVNVGDIVDVGLQSGTVKSIGFRSSIISIWQGADVVMPNGDLLNAHLVNWTLGGNRKRLELIIGVAYNTDLEKAKKVLNDTVKKDERILKYPSHSILFSQFNQNSIDIRIFVWVKHLRDSFGVTSDLIAAINIAFKENNIQIPFPRRDIHIYNQENQSPPEQNNNENDKANK
jgi:small-conductance mechanosensitive channel